MYTYFQPRISVEQEETDIKEIIDEDAVLGIPLKYNKNSALSKPYVDWNKMRILLKIKGVL